jgi:2-desacetyl-2-hydroxyethyl bacteriochlorophyllide A dehydrogenase
MASSIPQARRVVFTGKQQVQLENFDVGEAGPGEVRVRMALSLMSTGTENIVFNRLFDPGTHWDNWVKYPFYPGYSAVGTVEAVGPDVKTLKVGDRVATRNSHASHSIRKETDCHLIPAEISFAEAVWFALAKITFQGARAADYKMGDSVLIIGAGPIGQMSVRWARAAGAQSIIVVDSIAGRLELASIGGATATISQPIAEAKEAVLQANRGELPRVVIDSTGAAPVFSAALGLAARYGTVVILGDTGTPSGQKLTGDVITRGLRIVGAHDGHNTEQWNDGTIVPLFFSLAKTGRFSLAKLNSHTFRPEDCAEAYGVANRDRASTMGIIFAWSK